MHPVVLAAELARCRCSHSYGTYPSTSGGYGNYWIFSWLWREVRWWSLLVYTGAAVAFGMLRAALGGGSDC